MAIVIRQALTSTEPADLERIRGLFLEYQEQIHTQRGVELCFQGFAQELANLPGAYAPPRGRLYLAMDGAEAVGCVGFRPHDDKGLQAEMKRLYVRPGYREKHVGRDLVVQLIHDAREAGYRSLILDTLPGMQAAQSLYESLGFVDVPPPALRVVNNPQASDSNGALTGMRFLRLGLRT